MAGHRSAIASAPPRTSRVSASALARIRLSHVWATTAVVIPVLVMTRMPIAMIDLAYHLRAGDIMFETHAILRTDVFSAPGYGRPWLNQQWLAQIVMTTAFRLGGWFGLVVLRALLIALVLTFVFLACRAAGAATKRAALLTLARAILLTGAFMLRPHLLGMVCFAATAWLVACRRTRPETVWIVVPITVLWANLHGSFFLAPLLLGVAAPDHPELHRGRVLPVGRRRGCGADRQGAPTGPVGVAARARSVPGDRPGRPARRVVVGHGRSDRACRRGAGPAGWAKTPGPRRAPERRHRRATRGGPHRSHDPMGALYRTGHAR